MAWLLGAGVEVEGWRRAKRRDLWRFHTKGTSPVTLDIKFGCGSRVSFSTTTNKVNPRSEEHTNTVRDSLKSMTTHHSDFPVLDTYQAVVSAFSDFLTVAIHTILYERNIYPQTSFISARKYNYPVKQSRHPKVCKWIQDAVAAVEVEMLKVTVPGLCSSAFLYATQHVRMRNKVFLALSL